MAYLCDEMSQYWQWFVGFIAVECCVAFFECWRGVHCSICFFINDIGWCACVYQEQHFSVVYVNVYSGSIVDSGATRLDSEQTILFRLFEAYVLGILYLVKCV
ncbi:hypothetical protein BpHYR1_007350 [Brachionus plicatilis]|uniref:Uncharacterized protein n=1 Tax=Brachionus plicatilis TaxID=10195 RepID=A0A3M7PD13_BRAPC|nr:hypothetical protein BpHYR1_007350 [Brachionus plicatilis]